MIEDVIANIKNDVSDTISFNKIRHLSAEIMRLCLYSTEVSDSEARDLIMSLAFASGVMLAELNSPNVPSNEPIVAAMKCVYLGSLT